MSEAELTARKKLGQDLRYWKKFPFSGFATGVLNLEAAVNSLDTPDPFIYARQDYASWWFICKVGSQFKAMFHTAVVWSGSSHLETGNYVPEGQVPPTKIAEGRVQRKASNRCQIDYVIDTRFDKTIFSHQTKFETLVVNAAEFNKSCKPRRNWQRGDNGYDNAFTFSAQIFVRPYNYDMAKLQTPPYALHPWVQEVVQPKAGKQDYYANPYRPEIWDCTTGTMIRIDKATPSSLQKGDIVWMSFYVEFIIGQQTWATQLTPRHLIRVGTIPSILIDTTDEGDAAPEQEPDYAIKEGATFLMNVDYPMDDETAKSTKRTANAVVSNKAPDDLTHVDASSAAEVKLEGAQLQDEAGSSPGVPFQAVNDAITDITDSVGRTQHNEVDSSTTHTQQNVVCEIDDLDEPLTPPPSSPRATTPAEWAPSPVPKQSMGADGKNPTRGTKRAADDFPAVQPAKKGRQGGGRRPRNV